MSKKPVKTKVVAEDASEQNQKTVDMKPNKSNALSTAITLIASMSGDEINKLLPVLQQNSQSAAASIPDGTAEKNAASIAMKGVVQEELTEIFGGEELTEDFKERITVLFEAAVSSKVAVALTEAEEKFNELLNEQADVMTTDLIEKVDRYLTYVAEEWMTENEIAIESGIRTEIAEQFIHGLKDLFQEHYIDVPDEKIDVVESLTQRTKDLESELNEVLAEKIKLEEAMAHSVMEDVFTDVADGLAMTESSKFRTLAESVEYDGDVDAYKKKLNIIKEKHFNKKVVSNNKSLVLNESVEADESKTPVIDSVIAKYAEAIQKSAKN